MVGSIVWILSLCIFLTALYPLTHAARTALLVLAQVNSPSGSSAIYMARVHSVVSSSNQ